MSDGVNVFGYLNTESGLGEAGRLLVRALRSVDYPVSTIGVASAVSKNNVPFTIDKEWKYNKVIMSVNSNELTHTTYHLRDYLKNKYVIGQWFWELEYFPPSMHMGFNYVNEVWSPTEFITKAIDKYAPNTVKVNKMQLPLLAPEYDTEINKIDIGVEPDRYMFFFTFSFYSMVNRKNPAAIINAFKKAFKPNEGPVLVIKSANGDKHYSKLKELQALTEGRTDIKIIDKVLEPTKLAALLNITDCYVSLHRSEGLGLSIAEAMALGKPVIATNYSGNTEFMNDYVSLLMPWDYVDVGMGNDVYPPTAKWAEVDVIAASQAMRYVYEHQNSAKIMGQHAKEHIETHFSLEATGKRMAEYLNSL